MKQAFFSILLISMAFEFAVKPCPAADNPSEPKKDQDAEIWVDPLTGLKFVHIEGGCFEMGQIPLETRLLNREVGKADYQKYYADELPRHKVCLDSFWMSTTEVPQKVWVKVMEFNPSHFNTNENFPVDSVSWQDANNFIDKLNEANNTKEFRLPTEAEWEFASRGNANDTMYCTGNTITSEQANFNGSIPFGLNLRDEYRKSPVEVDSYSPNSYGLYNMHGNVWEWCSDWYDDDYYEDSPLKNPPGPEEGDMRVLRGGSWFRYTGHIRSATRYKNKPTGQYADTGIRVVKSPQVETGKAQKPDDKLYFNQDF